MAFDGKGDHDCPRRKAMLELLMKAQVAAAAQNELAGVVLAALMVPACMPQIPDAMVKAFDAGVEVDRAIKACANALQGKTL